MAKAPTLSFLSQLSDSIVEKLPSVVTSNVRTPREKMLQKINEQVAILLLLEKGETPQQRRIWFAKQDGTIYVSVKYGNRPVMLNGNKLVMKADGWEAARSLVETIKQAVQAGELDEELARITTTNRGKDEEE